MFFRTLRAFAWIRWRVLVNSLDRTGARDTIERFSLAAEQIGPLIAFAMLVPSAVALAGLGGYAGYWMGKVGAAVTFQAIAILLLIACGMSVVGPLLMPSIERTSAVRLLLLPIPRRTLYVAQAAGAVSDPWVLLAIPVVLAIPIGLALAGAFGASLLVLAAGTLLLVNLVGLTALSTFVLQLIVRDRRRGELVALLLVLLPMIAMLPGLLNMPRSGDERRSERAAAAERRARGDRTIPEWAWEIGERAYHVVPSALFTNAVRTSTNGDTGRSVIPLGGLAAVGLTIHGLGLLTFGRLLDSPLSGSRRQARSVASPAGIRIPGLSRASGAVAYTQLRLAFRTPRGKSIMLSPVLMLGMLMLVMFRGGGAFDMGILSLGNGLAVATFGSAICLLSIVPFAMNQFAIDRAGLTLALLAPLDYTELLIGKAVGNALVIAGPTTAVILMSYLLFRDGSLALWLSLPLGVAATYALVCPGAAALSAIFPRTVDLNSIGRGSNAHGAAALLGLGLFVAAAIPCVLLAALAIGALGRPALTPFLMLVWCGAAIGLSHMLLRLAARIVERRRENLSLVAS